MTTQKAIYTAPTVRIQEVAEDLMQVAGGGSGALGISGSITSSEQIGAKDYDVDWEDEE